MHDNKINIFKVKNGYNSIFSNRNSILKYKKMKIVKPVFSNS